MREIGIYLGKLMVVVVLINLLQLGHGAALASEGPHTEVYESRVSKAFIRGSVKAGEAFLLNITVTYDLSKSTDLWIEVWNREKDDSFNTEKNNPLYSAKLKSLMGEGLTKFKVLLFASGSPTKWKLRAQVYYLSPLDSKWYFNNRKGNESHFDFDIPILRKEGNPTPQILRTGFIKSRIDNGPWLRKKAIYPLKGQRVSLMVPREMNAEIRWFEIFPDIETFYNNAGWPGDDNEYEWLGLTKIRYGRVELKHLRNQWTIVALDNRGNVFHRKLELTSNYRQKDVGSFWYQAEIHKGGKVIRSPGIEEGNDQGMHPDVFRISVRENEGYIGYVTSFYNVPGIFGSTTDQANNYIGADCADLLMTAYYKWKGEDYKKNYNVRMLVRKFPHVMQFGMQEGRPARRIEWGKDVFPGDFIIGRSVTRKYGHIGTLYKDVNHNGELDREDLFLHAGPFPLIAHPLKRGAFDGVPLILRPERERRGRSSTRADRPGRKLPQPQILRTERKTGDNGFQWVFPDSSERFLTRDDLEGLSPGKLWQARNEIFARHGFIFKSERGRRLAEELGKHYQGKESDSSKVYENFNEYEKHNIQLIKKFEDGV